MNVNPRKKPPTRTQSITNEGKFAKKGNEKNNQPRQKETNRHTYAIRKLTASLTAQRMIIAKKLTSSLKFHRQRVGKKTREKTFRFSSSFSSSLSFLPFSLSFSIPLLTWQYISLCRFVYNVIDISSLYLIWDDRKMEECSVHTGASVYVRWIPFATIRCSMSVSTPHKCENSFRF